MSDRYWNSERQEWVYPGEVYNLKLRIEALEGYITHKGELKSVLIERINDMSNKLKLDEYDSYSAGYKNACEDMLGLLK